MAIHIVLSSYIMGNVDEVDFDLWRRFVAERIDDAMGFEVAAVSQLRLGDAGDDVVLGGTAEQREAIRSWLKVDGWNDFCAQGGPWETMRREHDTANASEGAS